jgi:hypothetical protein
MGEAIGPTIQFAVSEMLITTDNSNSMGAVLSLLLVELVNTTLFQIIGLAMTPTFNAP